MFTRLKMAMLRFMQGRNGIDNLGYHAWWAGLILSVVNMFLGSGLLSILDTALLCYGLFRMFSRNIGKRQEENRRYVQFFEKAKKEVQQFFLRLKGMRTYKYFRCPGCRARLRLKRGAGEKHITCPVCKHEFDQRA